MDNLAIRTVLSAVSPVKGEHSLSETPLCGKINLRGDINTPEFKEGVETALGLSLPGEANTVTTADDKKIFWLGPDEWLVHVPLEALDETIKSLSEKLADIHAAITDVSDYYSVIELTGPQAREIIATASPFDTRAQNFQTGQCAQTLFGHASVLLWPVNDKPTFAMQARWSYAQYVYAYLGESIANTENLDRFRQEN